MKETTLTVLYDAETIAVRVEQVARTRKTDS
jgi:hypothetical protein